jgi:hypothetical protein
MASALSHARPLSSGDVHAVHGAAALLTLLANDTIPLDRERLHSRVRRIYGEDPDVDDYHGTPYPSPRKSSEESGLAAAGKAI